MKSVMTHNFSQIPSAEIQRSSFDRSHGCKTTFDAGWLIPVYVDEALPGDTFNLNMSCFARLATLIKPPLDNMFLDSFFFSVPVRMIWDNWEKFNGAQDDPGDSTDFLVPYMNITPAQAATGSLHDYFGIPIGNDFSSNLQVNSLWHRAYNMCWNTWFRDQNLQNSIVVDKGDGPDISTDYVLKRRGKRHDYFTSCLPWPQKGPDVLLPLGDTAPIMATGDTIVVGNAAAANRLLQQNTSNDVIADGVAPGSTQGMFFNNTGSPSIFQALEVDLTSATAATINAIRQAFQLQRLYERDARGGTRYIEILKAHFNVVSPDMRAVRPEYLGGGSTPVNIHPVSQNSVSAATPQGNLAAFGTASASGHGFTKSFTEHCILLGLVSVRADLTYQQGLDRMFSRRTRFDFYWPALSHIGEQEVLNKEIFAIGGDLVSDNGVFGYQERFAEYRYKQSKITGLFRSNATGTLDMWHLSQDFASLPTLASTFIEENPPIDRIIAVPAEPHFLFDSYFNLRCARPMPTYSVPGMIDHF